MNIRLTNILFIISAGLILVLRNQFIHICLEFQKRAFDIKYGDKEVAAGKTFVTLIALVLLALSILSLFGIDISANRN